MRESRTRPIFSRLSTVCDILQVSSHFIDDQKNTLQATDRRIRAAAVLDNLPPIAEREAGFRVPLLLLRADGWEEAELVELARLWEKPRAVVYEGRLAGAEHMSFSDTPLFEPSRFRGELDILRGLEISSACLRTFFERHLDRRASALSRDEFPNAAELHLQIFTRE